MMNDHCCICQKFMSKYSEWLERCKEAESKGKKGPSPKSYDMIPQPGGMICKVCSMRTFKSTDREKYPQVKFTDYTEDNT